MITLRRIQTKADTDALDELSRGRPRPFPGLTHVAERDGQIVAAANIGGVFFVDAYDPRALVSVAEFSESFRAIRLLAHSSRPGGFVAVRSSEGCPLQQHLPLLGLEDHGPCTLHTCRA